MRRVSNSAVNLIIEQHFKDVVALVILLFLFVLIALGYDSVLTTCAATIIGYYFGRRDSQNFSVHKKLYKR